MKSLNSPSISDEGVQRLFAMTQPKRMNDQSTLFTAGYEQAKADFRERLVAEIGRPTNDVQSVETAADTTGQIERIPPQEHKARRDMAASGKRWWHL